MSEPSLSEYVGYGEERGWTAASFGSLSPEQEHYMLHELRHHGVKMTPGSNWIELGYGNGSLLELARRCRVSSYGIEAQPDLLELGRRAGAKCEKTLTELLQKHNVMFDAILAFDVFEHIAHQDLITWLQLLRGRAHSGTRLLARFPNGDSPFSLIMQNGDITHRSQLGGGAIVQILRLAGWECVYLGEPVWVELALWRKVKTAAKVRVRRALERAVGSLYFGSGGPPTLYQNYILVARPVQPR